MSTTLDPSLLPKIPSWSLQALFLSLYLWGACSCLVLSLTVLFAPSIRRHSYVPNYLILTVAFSICSCLTILAAGGYLTEHPTGAIAIFQAGAILGGGISMSVSDFLLAVILLANVLPHGRFSKIGEDRSWVVVFHVLPWTIWFVVMGVGIQQGLRHPEYVIFANFWCMLGVPWIVKPYLATMMFFFAATVMVDACMAIILLRHHHATNSAASQDVSSCSASSHVVLDRRSAQLRYYALGIRCVGLGLIFLVNFILDALLLSPIGLDGAHVLIYEAARGIFIFLIFASQRDIFSLYLKFFKSILSNLMSLPSTIRSFLFDRHETRSRKLTASSDFSGSSELRYLPRLSRQDYQQHPFNPTFRSAEGESKSTHESVSSKLGLWKKDLRSGEESMSETEKEVKSGNVKQGGLSVSSSGGAGVASGKDKVVRAEKFGGLAVSVETYQSTD